MLGVQKRALDNSREAKANVRPACVFSLRSKYFLKGLSPLRIIREKHSFLWSILWLFSGWKDQQIPEENGPSQCLVWRCLSNGHERKPIDRQFGLVEWNGSQAVCTRPRVSVSAVSRSRCAPAFKRPLVLPRWVRPSPQGRQTQVKKQVKIKLNNLILCLKIQI